MPTTTNYGWTTPADTDLVKDGASAIRTLGTAIDTTVFNNASAAIAKSIVDAKGDIIAATAADTVARLAVGANNTVLIADSSTATGLKWGTLSTGKVLQVVYGSSNTQTTVASTTYTDTTLSATITPSATTSKVLILVSQSVQAERGSVASSELGAALKLLRNTTDIYVPAPTSNNTLYSAQVSPTTAITWTFSHYQSLNYLDSPSTTSSTTYKTQGRSFLSTSSGSARFQDGSNVSTMILLEIGA